MSTLITAKLRFSCRSTLLVERTKNGSKSHGAEGRELSLLEVLVPDGYSRN